MPQGQRPYQPFADFTNYKHNEWEMVSKCRDFLEDASLHGNCKSITTSKSLKCNCLKFLDKSIAREAITLYYMVAFFNKSKSAIVEDLVDFFDELKELGQPHSTRIMQVETGVGLSDGEEGVKYLLLVLSQPGMDHEIEEEFEFSVGSSSSYNPSLMGNCHVFCNCLGYVRYETSTEPGADTTCFTEPSLKRYFLNKKKTEGEEVLAEHKMREVFKQNNVYAPLVIKLEAALSENNKILMEASPHAIQAADQRRVCNRKRKEAHHDYLHGIEHSEQRYCLVVEYCQNAQLPNLGATQPGDTYYMMPLTGGDNVASIIIMLLKHKGWLKEDEIGGKLTVLMDNCGGQNKNNHVLHQANLLVEAGYFKKFNLMKRDYQNQNLYTLEQLCKALDLFYKELKTGTIQPGHIFTVESDASTTMTIWQDQLGTAAVSVQNLQKRLTVDRDCLLQEAVRDFMLLNPLVVPAEFVDTICPYPGVEVMRKFKEERNRKACDWTQRKRDSKIAIQ
eukprot:jgi/Psemu1/41809/gm1.41809_g